MAEIIHSLYNRPKFIPFQYKDIKSKLTKSSYDYAFTIIQAYFKYHESQLPILEDTFLKLTKTYVGFHYYYVYSRSDEIRYMNADLKWFLKKFKEYHDGYESKTIKIIKIFCEEHLVYCDKELDRLQKKDEEGNQLINFQLEINSMGTSNNI